jgi:succinylarginine dihydrolase
VTDPKNIIHFDTGRGWRGGQNQVYLLIRELKKCGINQTLIAPGESPLIQKIREAGIDTYELDSRDDIDLKAVYKL